MSKIYETRASADESEPSLHFKNNWLEEYFEEPIKIDLDCIKTEMDSIQKDLHDLVVSLNSLVDCNIDAEETKRLAGENSILNKEEPSILVNRDGNSFRSINWKMFGPFVDNIVADLHKLKMLNSRTNQVVRRIRNISVVGHLGNTGSLIIDN